ncbi:DUF4920 domain-containing protein [Hymenobacter sp.]|uniref:DUF4920 domain-containing protein n=1 Tax=Hymenobacter sp. TaxID=1898978 RepID=UPI00286A1F7E|nr:DUF4920 domain-containing protein [Hymenobacter sp.]
MKYFLSFVGVLVAILLYIRFVPSAPINPVLPVPQGQEEVNGHNSEVPKGASEAAEREEEAEGPSTRVAPAAPGQTYGAVVTPAGAVPMSALNVALGTRDSARVKLTGKATAVCQAKGCWMTLPTADGKEMRVRFRDYAFFVPKDLSGHTVVVSGWAHRSTVPKEELRHYAQDAGKPDREIAAITQDEQQLTFLADGVLVQD